MNPHAVEESHSDSQRRWEDDGGAIPLGHSGPTTKAVRTLGEWKAVHGGFVYTKPHSKRARNWVTHGE